MRNPALGSGNVWVLTATNGYLGEIVSAPIDEAGGWIVSRRVSWVADTGRRSKFMTGDIADAEIEVDPPARADPDALYSARHQAALLLDGITQEDYERDVLGIRGPATKILDGKT